MRGQKRAVMAKGLVVAAYGRAEVRDELVGARVFAWTIVWWASAMAGISSVLFTLVGYGFRGSPIVTVLATLIVTMAVGIPACIQAWSQSIQLKLTSGAMGSMGPGPPGSPSAPLMVSLVEMDWRFWTRVGSVTIPAMLAFCDPTILATARGAKTRYEIRVSAKELLEALPPPESSRGEHPLQEDSNEDAKARTKLLVQDVNLSGAEVTAKMDSSFGSFLDYEKQVPRPADLVLALNHIGASLRRVGAMSEFGDGERAPAQPVSAP